MELIKLKLLDTDGMTLLTAPAAGLSRLLATSFRFIDYFRISIWK